MNHETVDARLNPSSHLKVVKPQETADDYHTNRHGSGGGGGGDMLERVKALEDKVSSLVVDVAILKDKVATKEDIQASKVDLHKELNLQTWKIIGSLVIAVLLAVLSKYFIK